MPDWSKYRDLFPHTQELVYMNHASVSPFHKRTIAAMQQFLFDRSRTHIGYQPEAWECKGVLKNNISRMIQAPAENIALIPNTSIGFSHLVLGLDWQPGDRILLNDFEFPANVYPFKTLRRLGVEIDFVKHRNGRIEIDDMAAMIQPRTRLLSISFVEFLNGFRNDLGAIGELCRRHNLIFSVDGIQGVGVIPLDVTALGIDFLSCGGQKWLMWPMGTAFMYVAPRLMDQLYPALSGWLSVENSWDFFDYDHDFLPDGGRFEGGTVNVSGIVVAAASAHMFLEIGIDQIWTRIRALTDYLIEQLESAGLSLFTIKDQAHRSGIVTFYHARSEALIKFLVENNVYVSIRSGMIRISPHFYNNWADIDRLLDLIRSFERST